MEKYSGIDRTKLSAKELSPEAKEMFEDGLKEGFEEAVGLPQGVMLNHKGWKFTMSSPHSLMLSSTAKRVLETGVHDWKALERNEYVIDGQVWSIDRWNKEGA